MAKADRILDLFPAIYATLDRVKLLSEVVRNLAQPIEEADTHLFRIQRAHRINVAECTEDILRLAALLNLSSFHFEDILTNEHFAYDKKLDLMRLRVKRIAQLHLLGLGTPWAILESTAIFLNAKIIAEHPGDPLIAHTDEGGFSHKAVVESLIDENNSCRRIYLHENPIRRAKIEQCNRWPMQSWPIENKNIAASPIKLVILGVDERTVLPSVFCPGTGEGIHFNGFIPEGKMLIIDEIDGATIDGFPVDDWLIHSKGGLFNFGTLDNVSFVEEQSGQQVPFDGDLSYANISPIKQIKTSLIAPMGKTEWYFKVAEGIYDASAYDYAVCAVNHEPIGIFDEDNDFDACVFDYPSSALIGMAWDERIPCSFKLVLPQNKILPQNDNQIASTDTDEQAGSEVSMNNVSRMASVLPRFKAAGITAFVDIGKDAWYLGECTLRSLAASKGEGIDIHATKLQDQYSDMIVVLEESHQ